ncbi:fatty acyl-coa reductase 3 [Phtheirospermum japonicum]|uniref:Fatty acyl-CoA reductase n=1 Tax=Phtheirospermum japonicum TaxID=374723 RepID=A0A830D097_9LAMI|nr:fatty acyl-coa reductase 3 [Phtheirospermum japonicum]
MELNSILKFLENRCILLTGATGFLAKVFIEKILRVQPNVKRLYLLLRAADNMSAFHRFNTEVMAKDLFVVVKEKYGPKLDCLIQQKITLLAGDITLDCLGLKGPTLEQLYEEVEIVINLAATTAFDERFDIALGINTIGPANVLSFSKKCSKLRVLLHVSTAYVCGEKEGLILETPLEFGETLNGTSKFDINKEKEIMEDKLKELRADKAPESHVVSVMKDLGIQRARKYGWPNTYSFTKAMGEMVLGHLKGQTPLVIIRPTIIASTFKEPFPGWLEGVRNIDSFVVGYGKGKLTCFPGDPQSVVDLIPADMVVNSMIVSLAAHADEPTETIYHVGSSMSNPVLYHCLQDYGLRFFTERPWINKDGKPVIVRKGTELSTKDIVRRYMQMHYLIPLKILSLVNTASCQYFQGTYLDLARKVKLLMRLVELFSPYVFFKGVFDDMNTERLRRAAKESCGASENEIFNFDPKCINWDDYVMYTHIAGVVKHAFRR